jgi:hypothetical protein
MITVKMILKDVANCWLSFVLSQPVEFDILILSYFLFEYTGIFLLRKKTTIQHENQEEQQQHLQLAVN